MSIITSQQLTKYYEQYTTVDVTFNKQVVTALGLVTKGVYLKIQDRQLPCMVFSSSMSTARVIANVPAAVMLALKQANNRLALRWCFKLPEKLEPITFFVPCRPAGFTHYAVQGPDVQFVSLEFTQRPPDDLIQILGSLLEANANAQRRKDERIVLTAETVKKLGLESREAALILGPKTLKCILRDLSFSGAKVVVSGSEDAFKDRAVSLKFSRTDEMPEMTIPASVRRVEEIGGRKDILAVSMEYSADPPTSYKLLINSYVSTIRKAAPAAGDAAPAAASTDSTAVSPEPVTPDASIPDEGDPSEGASGANPVNG
jgi:PilZ domain